VQDREYLDHFSDFYDWYFHPVNLPGQLYLWPWSTCSSRTSCSRAKLKVAGTP